MSEQQPAARRADRKKGTGRFFKSPTARCALLYAALTVVVGLIFVVGMIPQKYDLREGQVPTETIMATKDIVDQVTTERRRQEAENAVAPTYIYESGVADAVMTQFDEIFAELRLVRQYGETLDKQPGEGYTREELNYAGSMLTTLMLRDYQLKTLLSTSKESFDALYNTLYPAIQNTMNNLVNQGQEKAAIQNISLVVGFKVESSLLQNVVMPLLSACIRPNMVVDEEALALARQKARDAVEDVIIRQGENIVVKGEGRITANQISLLRELGLLNDASFDPTGCFGMALMVCATMALMYLVLAHITKGLVHDVRRMLIFCLVVAATVLLCALTSLLQLYMMPVLLAVLLLTALDSLRTGITVNAALSALMAVYTLGATDNDNTGVIRIFLLILLGGTAAGLIMRKSGSRFKPLIAGVAGAAVYFAVMSGLSLITVSAWTVNWEEAMLSPVGPVLSGLLAMVLLPLIESLFNLPTPMHLLELSNPNSPLLKRLMLEAPGTYHHSILVANLAEAAAEAVGANPLLARVGAYYHDIGKLKRPQYFSENQVNGVNAHDHTEPEMSARILTAHTRDGVALAREYHLPVEIQQIIADHHGNSPVMYFYHKAVQQADGKPVDINTFRYDGNKPSTQEEAIIMLCDTIEAAVRSRKDHMSEEELENYIVKLVRGKVSDGQLNNAPLTLKDIDAICAACTLVLKGVNHERVAYPDARQAKARSGRQPAAGRQETAPIPALKPEQLVVSPTPAPVSVMTDALLQDSGKPEEIETENAPAYIPSNADMAAEQAEETPEPETPEQETNNE